MVDRLTLPLRVRRTGLVPAAVAIAIACLMQVGPAAALNAWDDWAAQRLDPEAQDIPIEVASQLEGDTRIISGRMLLLGSQEIYIRSATAASIFKASRFWQTMIRQLTLHVRDQSFQLTAGSRLVVYDGGEQLLPTPVLAIDGDIWIPMEFFVQILGPVIREAVVWDLAPRRLRIGSARYNVTGLRVEQLTRATAVHVLCDEPLSFRASSSDPGYVTLKIYNGVANPSSVGLWSPRGLVESVSARQYQDHAKVFVKVDDLVNRFRTYTRQEGKEIVLVLEEERISILPDPTPRGRVQVILDESLIDVTRPIDVQTVVIDPGHGGIETGKVGTRGSVEKDINLAIAKELKRYLERRGKLRVVLTRDKDDQLGLTERSELANRSGGDMFISLHCNGWFNGEANGVETYFLSPAKTDWTRSVADYENQNGTTGGGSDDISFILWELVQNQYISASSNLAELVQESLSQELSATNRGVKQAGFRVLVGAYMPAILIEMGFLSNRDEESKLRDASYQRSLAEAVGEAVLAYKERYALSAEMAKREGE